MIPFKLFKYIYFRNILYGFIATTLLVAILTILSLSFANVLKESVILFVISYIVSILISIFINKFILRELLFKKYKRITVNTDLKSVSIKFTIIFILITRIAVAIPYFGFIKMFSLLCGNNLFLFTFFLLLCSMMYILGDYYVTNLFLEKYITVNEKNEEE